MLEFGHPDHRRRAVAEEAALTNDMVIKMVQGGLPADTIIRTINTAPTVNFGFLPSDLTAISNAKVPEDVFKAMALRHKTVVPVPSAEPVPAKSATPTPALVSVAARPANIERLSAAPITAPTGKGYAVKYSGGSLESLKAGEDLKLFVASEHIALPR